MPIARPLQSAFSMLPVRGWPRLMILVLVLSIPVLMAGCASVSVAPAESPQEQAANALLSGGKYRQAAQAYLEFAATASSPARDRALVRAAESWQRAGDAGAARSALAQANRRRLAGEDALLHDLLSAQFLLSDHKGREALALLNQNRDGIPAALRTRWHGLRAQAFEANSQFFEVATEYAWLIGDQAPRERTITARNIARLLGALPSNTLAPKSAALASGDPLYPYAARELAKRSLPLPHPLAAANAPTATKNFPPADPDGYRPPDKLAVVLPMTGPVAAASAGVRDGLLAAYYAEQRRRPTIKFYDSTGTAAGAQKAIAQAVADGAQMIIGPLTRDAVNAVFNQGDLGVPIIALNRGQNPPPPGSASFALLPDDEGLAAADRLADRGQMKVLVFSHSDDNAKRTLAAFREQLRVRGGEVIGEVAVGDDAGDINKKIAAELTRAKIQVEAVFMALKAAQARLVAAQLNASTLATKPRIASSLILSGGNNPRLDGELEGIEFPELPWMLDQRPDLPDSDALEKSLPSARGPALRLFGFGYDAWKLAAYLDQMNSNPAFTINGATGVLQLDNFGLVQREPAWAVFSGGRIRAAADGALEIDGASAR